MIILSTIFPEVLKELILEYIPTCYDCKKFKNTVYNCKKCNITRCNFHNIINATIHECTECTSHLYPYSYSQNMIQHCIYENCVYNAYYGTKTKIKYCRMHVPNYSIIYIYDSLCNIKNCPNRAIYNGGRPYKHYCEKHARMLNYKQRRIVYTFMRAFGTYNEDVSIELRKCRKLINYKKIIFISVISIFLLIMV